MTSVYYPYTKKQAIDIVSRYAGISKVAAKKQVEKDAAYFYGKLETIGHIYVEMENFLKDQAKKAFYED